MDMNSLPEVHFMLQGGSILYLEFMPHDKGCWAILSNRYSSVETGRINLGTYKTKEEIDILISALKIGI